jgi:CDP-diacylglycerol---serine O-phosphatidyltransferase
MIKRNLPNALTLGNLLCGCLAIQQLLSGHAEWAPWLMLASGILDFFDGMLARALNVFSDIGKDLDSLADTVSFGVLPGFMAYYLIAQAQGFENPQSLNLNELFPSVIAFLIPVLSAYRLANFNHDTRQSSSFIGLATPANGFFWAGLFYLVIVLDELSPSYILLASIALISALMLNASIPMFSFKFKKGLQMSELWPQLVLMLASIPLLILYSLGAFAPIILLYVFLSIIQNLVQKPSAS